MATEQAIKEVRDTIDKQLILPNSDKPLNSYSYNLPSDIVVKELYDKCDLPSAFRGLELSSVATIRLFSVNHPELRLSLLERSIRLKKQVDWKAAWIYLSTANRERSDYLVHRLRLDYDQQPQLINLTEQGRVFGKTDTIIPPDLVLGAFTSIIEQTSKFIDY